MMTYGENMPVSGWAGGEELFALPGDGRDEDCHIVRRERTSGLSVVISRTGSEPR